MSASKQIKLTRWVQTARPGERIVYARKKHPGGLALPLGALDDALKAHDAGTVFLAQRKDDAGGYQYEATRISAQTARILGVHPDYNSWGRVV